MLDWDDRWMANPAYVRLRDEVMEATNAMAPSVGVVSYLAYRVAKLEERIEKLEQGEA
jgi:hypothetical protein